ncbi:MAG TPA: hypothetical protein VF791_07925 [Pyrinomonadaceae bacterium]
MVTKTTAKKPKKGPNPAELPAPELGTGGSGGVVPTRPGGIGGPNELPSPVDLRATALINEVLSLRQRLHAMETQFLASALRTGRVFHPAELPEGGEGGSGGGGEIFPGEFPGEIDPAELPIDFTARATRDIASLSSRVASLEANLMKSIDALTKSINQLKTK